MRPFRRRMLITLGMICFGLSWGQAAQAAASDQTLPAKTFLPLVLSAFDGTVRVPITFTFTFAAGQYNSLPAGADRVRVTVAGADPVRAALAGAESFTAELLRSSLPDPNGAGQLAFYLPPGQYTYTAQALQGSLPGSNVLSTIGPIPITVSPNFPLSIPMIAAFATFDNYQTDVGVPGPNTQIIFGTEGRDRFVQYGGNADDTQFIESGAANDWLEQYGGGGNDRLLAEGGTENDYIYQDGGSGNDIVKSASGWGDDYVIQMGGQAMMSWRFSSVMGMM